jgi:hypothetical protein
LEFLNYAAHRRTISGVLSKNLRVTTLPLDLFDDTSSHRLVGPGSRDECKMAGTALHHPLREAAAETA